MTISELIWDGLELLAVGMGAVFVFLVILVICVMLMSKLAARLEALWPSETALETSPAGIPADHLAVISAAVHRYRSTHRPN